METNNHFKEFGKGLGIFLLYLLILPILALYVRESEVFGGILPNLVRIIPMSSFLKNNLLYLLGQCLFFLIIIFIFRKALVEDFKVFKKNWKKNILIALKYWLIGLAIMVVSNYIINYVLFKGAISANEEANREILKILPIYASISLTLLIPIIEELVFRRGFRKAFSKKWTFVLFTTFFFAGIHLIASFSSFYDITTNYYELLYIIPYGGLGFAFAMGYIKTDSIYTSIIMHVLQNILSLIIILTGI